MFGIRRALRPLYIQVIVGAGLGILLGIYAPDVAVQAKPLGDGFVKLLKMLAAPIIFTTVVVGIARTDDIKSVGRIGLKAMLWFEVATSCALLIGMAVGKVIQPGAGMNVDPRSLDAGVASGFVKTAQGARAGGVPPTRHSGHARRQLSPRATSSRSCSSRSCSGSVCAKLGQRGRPLLAAIEGTLDALFAVVAIVMRLAPLGCVRRHGVHHRPLWLRQPAATRATSDRLLHHLPPLRLRRAGRRHAPFAGCHSSASLAFSGTS